MSMLIVLGIALLAVVLVLSSVIGKKQIVEFKKHKEAEQIVQFIDTGNAEGLLRLIYNSSGEIDSLVAGRTTILEYAIQSGSEEMVDAILAAGASPHACVAVYPGAKRPIVYEPLASCYLCNDIEILRMLCGSRSDCDICFAPYYYVDRPGYQLQTLPRSSHLTGAAYAGSRDLFVQLLSEGCDPNECTAVGPGKMTSVLVAVLSTGDAFYVRALHKHGARLDVLCDDSVEPARQVNVLFSHGLISEHERDELLKALLLFK